MSKDIRSFFQVLSKKTGNQPKPLQKPKKATVLIDSDDDEIVIDTPEKSSPKKTPKRRTQIISSDSEDEGKSRKNKSSPQKKHRKIEEKSKLKPVNLDDFNKPIKQSKVEYVQIEPDTNKTNEEKKFKEKGKKKKDSKKSINKKNTEIGIHGDKDFERTLEELDADSDDTILLDNLDVLDRTIELAEANDQTLVKKDKDKLKESAKEAKDLILVEKYRDKLQERAKEAKHLNLVEKDREKLKTKEAKDLNLVVEKDKEKLKESVNEKETPKKAEKRQRETSESTPTLKKKQKLEHTDSGIDQDQEKWEKKRYSAGLFQAYLHRPEPKNLGQKMYPKGKPNCLSGLTFLRTGVLDSIDGEAFLKLVTDHGGKVVHGVSKKVNYVVVGEEPGPAKIEKVRHYKIPQMSEDEFLDMILVKSGQKPRYAIQNDSEDFGFGGSENGSDDFINIDPTKEEQNESKMKDDSYIKDKAEADSKVNIEKLSEPVEVTPEANESKLVSKAVKAESEEKEDLKQVAIKNNPASVKKACDQTQRSGTVSVENLSWTEKYKPLSMKEIIGQQEANSNMNILKRWLENWFKNQEPAQRAKIKRPNPFKPDYVGDYYKAALLSGPPGVGKTTTATLVAKELGFDIVEFNASDTRNKKLLHEEISQMMKSKTVAGFASGENNINQKRVLLMDEVDGISGNQDRGGIAELISFIKSANFPIICMCNDRDHQKMRTLVTYCFPLKFGRANVNQIRGAMLSICFKEGIKIKPDALARLIVGTRCDIRQTLNHLAMWSAAKKEVSLDVVQKESENSQKDVVVGPWDVIKTVLTKSKNQDMTLADREKLFFYDYSFGPLFVQENYLYVKPNYTGPIGSKNVEERTDEDLYRLSLAADSLSMSDVIECKIRTTNNWSMLSAQAFHSTVMPSFYASGTMHKCTFPMWFGMNSKKTKRMRIVNELFSHARTRISGDKNSLNLDYAESLKDLLLKPLQEKGSAGAGDALEVLKSYSLLRDDMLNLFELLHRFDQPNLYERVDSKVKLALTKLYNKKMVLSFAPPVASKKKSGKGERDEDVPEEETEEGVSDEEETEDNLADDALIKVKTKETSNASGSSKASTSKQGSKTKGTTGKQEATAKAKMSKTKEGKTTTSKGKGKK